MNDIITHITDTPVASAILAITLLFTLLAFYSDEVYSKFILHPYSVAKGQNVYTILTSGLIHKDWQHLFFNMMSYCFFAFYLETVIGHWQFGLLYTASLILSDLPTVLKHKEDYWYHSLGASGAISAVVFSYILFFPLSKIRFLLLPFEIPAIIFGGLYLLYCVYASRKAADSINHDAHFYGALSGVMITIMLYPKVVPYFFQTISAVFN